MSGQTTSLPLTARLADQIPPQIRLRGEEYFLRHTVRKLKGNDAEVRASVLGTKVYHVRLRYLSDRHALLARCDCAYVMEHAEPCKHTWATLRAADAARMLAAALHDDRLKLRIDAGEADADESDDLDIEGAPPLSAPVVLQLPTEASATGKRRMAEPPPWQQQLSTLGEVIRRSTPRPTAAWPAHRQLVYVIDAGRTLETGRLAVEVAYRKPRPNGQYSGLKWQAVPRAAVDQLPDAADRQIMSLLMGPGEHTPYRGGKYAARGEAEVPSYLLAGPTQAALLRMMCQTRRCELRLGAPEGEDEPPLMPLHWQDEAWELWLEVRTAVTGPGWELVASLRRGEQRMSHTQPRLMLAGGLVFTDGLVAPLNDFGAFPWLHLLRIQGRVHIPEDERDAFIEHLLEQPALPRLDLPAGWEIEPVVGTPRPQLRIRQGDAPAHRELLSAHLSFDYEGVAIPADHPQRGVYRPDHHRLVLRSETAEREAEQALRAAGFRDMPTPVSGAEKLHISPRGLPSAVMTLTKAGWLVEAEGKVFRSGGEMRMHVVSGVDWFELRGDVQFGDQRAALPELLAAIRRGDSAVRLDDGTFGILPQQWLEDYASLMQLAQRGDDHLRFGRSQLVLLEALLAAQPNVTGDEAFAKARAQLHRFEGIEPATPPETFTGELRPYQCEGLGWLEFLRRFGFGGCLADDMGLGKTVQVLAMLESRRLLRETGLNGDRPPPTLVVVPRSLVFNWKQEAARFTPKMRVLDHSGVDRARSPERFDRYDLVLTTYGTLRRDAPLLKDYRFDYAILDEAQTVKNPDTASAKATRLITADHRLALSGTPVENHLGELWSMLEFLNPGIRGGASLQRLTQAADKSPAGRQLLSRAVRPFILRRTKQQVAADLPEKLEQTIQCELDGEQRRLYDELRDHYRRSLLPTLTRDNLGRSKFQVLEALLRLRQAACHPGLIDKQRTAESSAKLEALLPLITEVVEEGHKALVFSQFTSMLAILRDRLDADPVLRNYEYIDGQTRDRDRRVQRFQEDDNCKLFLISLKAGGLGLNLTAAEYVFLLDPWWNPAVEAQAIDRAHRIGQTRRVFAYRLIARDTVEEKVLQLQESKRQLADALINEDNALLRQLDRETLELLLS